MSLLDDLMQLEAELHHHGHLCDPARLERLLHPAFHEVGRSGRPYTRGTVIAYLRSQSSAPVAHSDDYAVHAMGDRSALLTYRSTHRDGDKTDVALRSSIWLLEPVGWQLFYHQGTTAAAD